MPHLHIQVSGADDDALAERIAAAAVELTQRHLGKDPSVTSVMVDFVAAQRWFVAGRALGAGRPRAYHWTVSITDETNTKGEKAAYLQAVHAAMDALLGGAAEHSYTQVADMRAGAYGYGGRTQEHRYQHR